MYYKTLNEVNNNKATTFEEECKQKHLSIRKCEICRRDIGVRNVKDKPFARSCVSCHSKVGMLRHYKVLGDGERAKLATDKTKRVGPFWPNKNAGK